VFLIDPRWQFFRWLLALPTTSPRQKRRHASNTKIISCIECYGNDLLLDLLTAGSPEEAGAALLAAFAQPFRRRGVGRSPWGARSVHNPGRRRFSQAFF
jgi:hypothetical protein